MVNTDKLRGIIAEKGYSQRKIAKKLNVTEKTFYSKMKKGVFGTDEAQLLTKILNISDPAEIFFAD